MPEEAVSGREVLKGSPGSGRAGKLERGRAEMEAVTAVPANNGEVLRPWEKLDCGSSSMLHQQVVGQVLIKSKLQKFCIPHPQIESTVYTWIRWRTGFVQSQEWKTNLKIQILSLKHFWKNEDSGKVEEWAENLAVSTQIEERLSGSFLLMLFLHFSWKPLGSQTVALCKRKWKMYLNISAIKTTGMQTKKNGPLAKRIWKNWGGRLQGALWKGWYQWSMECWESDCYIYLEGNKEKYTYREQTVNILSRKLYLHFKDFNSSQKIN